MAKLNTINQLLLLALIFSMTKMTHGQGKLFVRLDEYKDTKDTTTKCIKICVTTSPSGFPRCNLNATRDTSMTSLFGEYTSYPLNPEHNFNFNHWEENSELSITVWKNPSKQSCDTSAPTNNTYHGEGSIIVPRLEELKTRYIVSDKWKLKVRTKLICDKLGCILTCMPQNDSTGHYTCADGNKKCLENWFNVHENCTTFCDVNSSTYKCTKYGSRLCNPGYFGRDCDVFCDGNATNYKCDEKGRRTCFANWYNKNCEQFCDGSKGNYLCDNEGNRVCLLHWYGENCSKYCNNSAERYKCDDKGDSVCLRNWYGSNCSKFCDNSNEHFKCNSDGDKVCLKNWYGKNCNIFCNNSDTHYKCSNVHGSKVCLKNWYGVNCAKYCNNSAERYKCDDKGDSVCLRNWYGSNCSKFCDNSNEHFKCNSDGHKICLKNWYGKNCNIFCNNSDTHYKCSNVHGNKVCLKNWYGVNCAKYCNNSATHFRCTDEGEKACSKNWYGPDCSKFCDNNNENFKCNTDGDKICMPNWYGKNCTIFCNNTAALSGGKIVRYFCNKNGQKTCIENRYGPECNLHCTDVMAEPSETNSGHEQSNIQLYYCAIEEGIEQEKFGCPKGWKNTNCLQGCHDQSIDEYVQKFRTKCDEKNGRALLCSNNTMKKEECSLIVPPSHLAANKQKSSRNDMSDVKLYGGLFGTLLLMVLITTVVVVHISLKKKKKASTSPIYETPRAMNNEIFARDYNRAEMTFTVDDYIRRRQSSADELGYDNEGMMVENPLYKPSMRAAVPFIPSPVTCSTSSPNDLFAMSNTAV